MAVAKAAVSAIVEEGMVENSYKMGELIKKNFIDMKSPHIKDIRGRGMLLAIEFHDEKAPQFVDQLRENGLITRPSGKKIVKFTPALIMNEAQIEESMVIFKKTLQETF